VSIEDAKAVQHDQAVHTVHAVCRYAAQSRRAAVKQHKHGNAQLCFWQLPVPAVSL
jgi:hypothetical protein